MSGTSEVPDPPRILLVEDDLDQAHLLKFLLEEGGNYSVTLAQDGLRATSLVREWGWDLIITDLNLPGADGMAVVEASRKHQPQTPILATTGHTGPEYADRARKEGADAVLIKPLDRDDLLTRVALLLEGGTPREAVELSAAALPDSQVDPQADPEASSTAPPGPAAHADAAPDSDAPPELLRVLAVSIRPGDAEAGCGGILLRHRKRGDRVVLLTLTHGASGDAGEARREEAKEAGRRMGVRFFVGNAGSGDDPLDEDLERLVRGALKEIRPHLLYIPTRHHEEPSFRAVHDTAMAAGEELQGIFAYDPGDADPGFVPDLFVPIDDILDERLSVLEEFDASGAEHLSAEHVGTAVRFWGRHVRGSTAEALKAIRGTLPSAVSGESAPGEEGG